MSKKMVQKSSSAVETVGNDEVLVLQVYLHILLCKTVTSFYISQLFLVQKIAVNNLLPKILLPFYPPVREWEVPQFLFFSLLINRNHWSQWREMLWKLSNIFLLSMTFLNMNPRKSLSKLFPPPAFLPRCSGWGSVAVLGCNSCSHHGAELVSQPGQDGAEYSREQTWQNILQPMNTLPVVCVERFFSCNHCPQKILIISLQQPQHKPPAGFGCCWTGSRKGEFTWCILGWFRIEAEPWAHRALRKEMLFSTARLSAAKDCQPGIFQCSPRKAHWARRAESLLVTCPESRF